MRVLIVSDLNPKSGWGRAALVLSKSLVNYGFEVLLFPIHGSRKKVPPDIAIISTEEFAVLRETKFFELIIHFDLPSSWMKYKYAKSIGYFFWESGSLPKNYLRNFQNVDQIWVPSNWQKKLILSYSPQERVFKVPIPLTQMTQFHKEMTPKMLNTEDYVLWMGTLEPRKGLRFFLREWKEYKSNGGQQALKLKVSSNNVTHTPEDIKTIVSALLGELAIQKKYLNSFNGLYSSLPQKDIESLYSNAKSVVGSSFGEGFGFVPVDGVMSGISVFWPSNTATQEWIPLGTDGAIECIRYSSFLKGDQTLYENPVWYPPKEGSIETALWKSEKMLEIDAINMREIQLRNLTDYIKSTEIEMALTEVGLRDRSGSKK